MTMTASLITAVSCFVFFWTVALPTALASHDHSDLPGLILDGHEETEGAAVVLLQLQSADLSNLKVRKDQNLLAASGLGLDTVTTRRNSSSTCGMDATVIKEDCNKPDMGSCGNACCALEVSVPWGARATYEAVATFLRNGGDGNAYALVDGTMPFNEHPPDDLTELGLEDGWKFIFQGSHTTSGRSYVDTLNFNIRSATEGESTLRAFSISNLHGALGDSGQNFKNLAFLLEAINVSPATATILYGCGSESSTSRVVMAVEPMAAGPSTCGMAGGVPQCEMVDMGSCGNACCVLEVATESTPRALYQTIAGFLRSGGDSNSYSIVPGAMPFNEHPPDDLTSLDIPGGWQFVFQGKHRTSGRGYVDTLDFNIRTENSATILRAFSSSDLHGALGDAGQNYKTLAYLLNATSIGADNARVIHGCGPK